MTHIPAGIKALLADRENSGAIRSLSLGSAGIDFCSNDYLGIARRNDFCDGISEWWGSEERVLGATGSRLVCGNRLEVEELESFIAAFHRAESALLFSSGFEANMGLLGALGRRGDTILYDEFVHASMRDGIRLSFARSRSFKHNDLEDLQRILASATGDVFIAVESVYSMDGDLAPLMELAKICSESGASLIVDEAHSTGVFGDQGVGLVQQIGCEGDVFARIHTFGKAVGFRGACVLGGSALRSYLINFARPFIYSTGPDLLTLWLVRRAYLLMSKASEERTKLHRLIEVMQTSRNEHPEVTLLDSRSPIQGVVVSGNDNVLHAQAALRADGFDVRAIRSPTVPHGSERIRICLHAYNTEEEVRRLVECICSTRSCRGAPARDVTRVP